METNTFMRQSKIYDPQIMNNPITVIGCGSLGSWITVALTKLGLTDFTLYDEDKIERHNLPNQFFPAESIGENKARTLRRIIYAMAPKDDDIKITIEEKFWTPRDLLSPGVIINAPDDIDIRKMVYESAPTESFIIDVRSGNDTFNVYCCDKRDADQRAYYERFFFSKENAAGTDCNAQATVYNSLVIASLVVSAYVRYARGEEYPLSIDGSMPECDIYPVFQRDIERKESKESPDEKPAEAAANAVAV